VLEGGVCPESFLDNQTQLLAMKCGTSYSLINEPTDGDEGWQTLLPSSFTGWAIGKVILVIEGQGLSKKRDLHIICSCEFNTIIPVNNVYRGCIFDIHLECLHRMKSQLYM
jgi:hypothetical protein